MRSRTTPYDVKPVRGYPDSLQVYRIEASSFWQVRLYFGGRHIRRSTRCTKLSDALEFAKSFFNHVATQQHLYDDASRITFAKCADLMIKRQASLIARNERDGRMNQEDLKKLNADILPWFGSMPITTVTTASIDDYIDAVSQKRHLAPSTLHKHLVVIRKVLKEAVRQGHLKAVPPISPIRQRDNPRPYFTNVEYRRLHQTARREAAKGQDIRGVPLDDNIADLIVFHVNVFVRLSDIKTLTHGQIQILDDSRGRALAIMPRKSKTSQRESISMEAAVDVYLRLLDRQKVEGFGKRNDYVFFPKLLNRNYALQSMERQFNYILKVCDLEKDAMGRKRTLYSLRHTALMFRLLNGDNIDIFWLAKNSLTSVSQFERFYMSHAEGRMRIAELQAYRKDAR